MCINVIFSSWISFFWLKRRSKKFFEGTAYVQRNGVFAHPKIDSVFALSRNSIYIRTPKNNSLQSFTRDYLHAVFNDRLIGISGLSSTDAEIFKSLNYVRI